MKKDDPPENATCHCWSANAMVHPCCASGVSDGGVRCDSRQASDRDRPCATLRISLNPVRSSIVQDLRLLPIDSSLVSRSPSIFLFLCVFLADKCVFQVISINKSLSSNKKLLSLVKLVKLFVSCIQKCYPSKTFRGSAPNPAAPDPHLQSTSIHRWLRPCLTHNIISFSFCNSFGIEAGILWIFF